MSEDEERGNETLRWPTNLDHAAIVRRLVQVRETAQANGLPDIASRFENVESMTAPQIGARVVAAMAWLQEKPEYRSITTQLEMVAMNLKNLK
ncbi:MAG TPA: hypothetical protein VKS43_09295 [Burkholderiales bacterium]|nr:hypothetical protein [Burkholderiales bacterium]